MADIISAVSSIVTASISWVTSFVNLITSTPLLLLYAIIPLVGLGVGLLKRLFSVN